MMDMAKLGEKVKIFQRRATQKVLQQMGMADKTVDDMNDHTLQNFNALGSFTSQLKATIQATDTTIEKMSTAQTHLAGQVQSYLHSELSGDTDLPPGELYDFFNSSHVPDAQMHAVLLQEVAEKFYSACSEIGNQFLRSLVNRLEDAVIKPISKDEEFNVITKDLMEEKKKAILDYDSYRRLASSSSSPGEQEKNDNKMRLAKEKLDNATRRLAEHIQQRNAIRCKVLVHGILTAMQQYHIFYTAAAETLNETAQAIKPLLDVYQLSENQLLNTVKIDNLKGSGKVQKLSSAESLFDEYNKPPKPVPPAKPSHHAAPRHVSPQPHDTQLNEMMQQSIAGMKKPAAAPYAKPSAPMNQQAKPQPPIPQGSPNSNGGLSNSTGGLGSSGGNGGGLSSSGNQGNPPPAPKPNLLDDLDDWNGSSGSNAAPPATADILDLGGLHPTAPPSTSPPPATPSSLFDNDLLGLGSTLQPNAAPFTPPLQPNNAPFTPLQPSKPVNSPTPVKASPQPAPHNPARAAAQPSGFPGGFPGGAAFNTTPQPPPKPSHNQAKPTPQFPQSFGFDMFGAPPQAAPATQQSGGFSQGPQQPQPAAAQSFVPAHQAAEQIERHELNPAITQKIQNWAERGGRQNNLRSLLSTLHEVIWVDSGWDARSLAELVTPQQVKKAYRQANMIVHPDKIQNGTVEQKLIAQRLFEALRVSYETFNKEECQ